MQESNKPDISIIVPIYNSGSLLSKCIDSIVSQSVTNLEIILVDDGSEDDSGRICDEYAIKDCRIKVIHKKNEGVSIARNVGIAAAEGEYIGFVDSDDWIDEDMYKDMLSIAEAEGADIVMCDTTTKYDDKPDDEDTITAIKKDMEILKKEQIKPELLLVMAGSACRCIYRTILLKKCNIHFQVGIKIAEDRIFNILAFGNMHKLVYLKKSYYNRYVRKGSAVHKYYPDMLDVILNARTGVMKALDEAWDGDKAYKDMYENQTVAHCFGAINNEFYKDAQGSFLHRYKNIKMLCNTQEIRNAITVLSRHDIRSRLIMKRMALPLCIIAIVLNKKHRR